MTCNDCSVALEPGEATCVASAQAPDVCKVHPECDEVYCETCWRMDV